MKNKHVFTSNIVSKLFNLPYSEEPGLIETLQSATEGIFLGNSSKMNMPIFLNLNLVFNPHMFIVGMTGSGKTYLMKSLLVRLSLMTESSVIMLDFTGEYFDTASLIESIVYKKVSGTLDIDLCNNSYFMLKGLKEKDKVLYASKVLKAVATKMRSNTSINKKRTFVLLDESWKLMDNNEDLEIIVREGRKYGVGLLLASQLLEDMSDGIVSNSASIFIFRMQVKKSAEKVMANYNLGKDYVDTIQSLDQGRCLLIKLDKNNRRSITVIRRVFGISLSQKTRLIFGKRQGYSQNKGKSEM